MTTRAKITTTTLLLLGLIGVGIADYQFAGREYAAELLAETRMQQNGVAKTNGPDVPTTLQSMDVDVQESEDLTFLAQIARGETVRSLVILQQGDRIGSVSWIDGDAKELFIDLKEALLTAFSTEVSDLSDQTFQEEGLPVRNVLTFRDPALSEERLTFIRVRERLYEFHSATGKEATMHEIINALTTQ